MARTAYDIVKQALMQLGAIDIGNAPDAWMGNLGLSTFNRMRASWNASGLACYGSATLELAATGAGSYTLGVGGTTTTRPVAVASVFYRSGDRECEIQRLNADDWREFSQDTSSGSPEYVNFDDAYPTETMRITPRPATGTIVITYRTPFAEIANLSDIVPDPPEYDEAFIYNLAVRLSTIPGLGAMRDATAALAAKTYDQLVKRVALNTIPQKRFSAAFLTTTDGYGI